MANYLDPSTEAKILKVVDTELVLNQVRTAGGQGWASRRHAPAWQHVALAAVLVGYMPRRRSGVLWSHRTAALPGLPDHHIYACPADARPG